jgi:hypothetical protein
MLQPDINGIIHVPGVGFVDYRHETQMGETRIQTLLDSQWEELARDGHVTSRHYVFTFDFERSGTR